MQLATVGSNNNQSVHVLTLYSKNETISRNFCDNARISGSSLIFLESQVDAYLIAETINKFLRFYCITQADRLLVMLAFIAGARPLLLLYDSL